MLLDPVRQDLGLDDVGQGLAVLQLLAQLSRLIAGEPVECSH
jgi:hypothetical protein